jgi:choline dehydrogenase-like flavoprotein
MLIDARTVPEGKTIETEVCIVGAGAAGITLAREFIGQSFRVCLLESGGLEFDKDTQSLYDGETVGMPYTPLKAARVRYYGGTTNHWEGWCRPLDEIDFESRDWIPHSGWPFGKSHLVSFYERAQSICQLGHPPYDAEFWEPENAGCLPFLGNRVKTTTFRFSPPTRFGHTYHDEIARARNITTYLNANAVEIETTRNARNVTRLRIACLQGNQFWVSAKIFILATGGIENARLLLLSSKAQSAGLGNQNDLVGRFFMDHAGLPSGAIVLSDPNILTSLYRRHLRNPDLRTKIDGGSMEKFVTLEDKQKILSWIRVGAKEEKYLATVKRILDKNCVSCHMAGGIAFFRPLTSYSEVRAVAGVDLSHEVSDKPEVMGALTLSQEAQHQEKLGNYCSLLRRVPWSHAIEGNGFLETLSNVITHIDDVTVAAYKKFFKPNAQRKVFRLFHIIEPAPNRDSRVALSTKRDRLGLNRVRLNWQLSASHKRTIRRSQEIIGTELGRAGLGRLMVMLDNDDTSWPSSLEHGWHHMGTTRMHTNSKEGVVDQNCQVHGISNLFIAGSSVFPTYGYSQPTLTIVALAVRLADHVKRVLKRRGSST